MGSSGSKPVPIESLPVVEIFENKPNDPIPEAVIRSYVEESPEFVFEGKLFDGLFKHILVKTNRNPVLGGFCEMVPCDNACLFKWAIFDEDCRYFWHSHRLMNRCFAVVLLHCQFQITSYSIRLHPSGVLRDFVVQGSTLFCGLDDTETEWEAIDEVFEDDQLARNDNSGHWNCIARQPYSAFRIMDMSSCHNALKIERFEIFGKIIV